MFIASVQNLAAANVEKRVISFVQSGSKSAQYGYTLSESFAVFLPHRVPSGLYAADAVFYRDSLQPILRRRDAAALCAVIQSVSFSLLSIAFLGFPICVGGCFARAFPQLFAGESPATIAFVHTT